jgi:uncharacterized protein YkwD
MPLSARPLPFLVAILFPLLTSPVQAIDLNGYRKANGLKPMSAHATLGALAKAHAADMARRGAMDHAGFYDVRARRGARAENVAYGCADTNCAIQQWINSSPHRANMLRPDLTRYGLGSAVSAAGQRFWALVMGK